MERLIMEFTVGDGFTYSSEVTYPIVYESKDKALHDFEILLIEKIDILYNLNEDLYEYEEQSCSLLKKLQKISADKRLNEKDKDKRRLAISQEFKHLQHNKITPLEKQIKDTETFLFGGQSFSLGQFVYIRDTDKHTDYCLPNIHTLDEYYSHIEKTLDNHSQLIKKNKM